MAETSSTSSIKLAHFIDNIVLTYFIYDTTFFQDSPFLRSQVKVLVTSLPGFRVEITALMIKILQN